MASGQQLRTIGGAVAACVCAIAVLESGPAAHDRSTQVTWTTDVEPILKTRCVGCHDAGGFGPMPLASYHDARDAAKAIRQEVLERRMPPWPAARGFGDFANDRSLTPLEAELLTAWADGGAPLGPPAGAPAAAAAATSSRAADLVLTVPSAHAVTALTAQFEWPTTLEHDQWMTGWEFRPGNRAIIEQAIVSIAPGTALGAWTPPEGAVTYPAGVAQRLPAGARVRLELRYRKSAAPQVDQSAVALYFGKRAARELRHDALPCGDTTLDKDIEALAVTPRVPRAGEWIEVVARRPDQSVEALCVVRRYETQYPITYRFRNAVRIPHGSVVHVASSSAACDADLEFTAHQ